MKLSVIGLGRLGLPMATLYASKGFDVIGVDVNADLVRQINKGLCPIFETGLLWLMGSLDSKLNVTVDYDKAVEQSNISFIIVPTPSDKNGKFINEYVQSVIMKLGTAFKEKQGYHLFVVTSTVMPGSCADLFIPELEKVSGKKCGVDFGVSYNPEFIALGSVIRDMMKPDVILIGESDKKAGNILEEFYRQFHEQAPPLPPICRMSLWNAEVAKLSLNVYITTKISLANVFAEICEKIPGGDVDKVTGFLGFDSRIGSKYLKGGTGFAGPCFPRDGRAFMEVAKQFGVACPIEVAVDEFNKQHNAEIVKRALEILKGDGKTVSILGLTYKPNTNIVEESPALQMIQVLLAHGYEVRAFDPEGIDNARQELTGFPIEWSKSIFNCLRGSDLCIITIPWQDFVLEPAIFLNNMRTPRVLDCWRMLDRECFEDAGVEYYGLGVNKTE